VIRSSYDEILGEHTVRDTNKVLEMLREYGDNKNYHPLCALLDLSAEKDATISEQINIHKSIAKYVEAENKAIEFIGVEELAPIKLTMDFGDA